MNEDYSICNLMPKIDYSAKLKEIQEITNRKTLSDQQKYILIKEITNQDLPGSPLHLT